MDSKTARNLRGGGGAFSRECWFLPGQYWSCQLESNALGYQANRAKVLNLEILPCFCDWNWLLRGHFHDVESRAVDALFIEPFFASLGKTSTATSSEILLQRRSMATKRLRLIWSIDQNHVQANKSRSEPPSTRNLRKRVRRELSHLLSVSDIVLVFFSLYRLYSLTRPSTSGNRVGNKRGANMAAI